jgi:tRNA (mo5U34)-methyltransferase
MENNILINSVGKFVDRRAELYNMVRDSPEFRATSVALYPHDTIGASFSTIMDLLQMSGLLDVLSGKEVKTVLDVGGANGDLSFVFASAGFETTFVDLSNSYEKAPLVASLINLKLDSNVRVVDFSVDGYFDYRDLIERTVNFGQFSHKSQSEVFDLVICLGLFYHLKNPFAFLESIHNICHYCILETWLMSHLPDNITKLRDAPIAYLLGAGELNNDSSNYWIFTDSSFRRLAERAGFSVISSASEFSREDKISNPVDIASGYGEKGYLLLRSR